MAEIVITGANRGIGLGLVRAFLAKGDHHVIACCRDVKRAFDLMAQSQQNPERVEICTLDVTDDGSINAFSDKLQGRVVDALINNAGVMGDDRQEALNMDFASWARTLEVNTLSPLKVTGALIENLKRANNPRVISVSSQMGAMSLIGAGRIAYKSSKAALNKTMQCVAEELRSFGICVVVVHPGWVRTDMGGPTATLSIEESVVGLTAMTANLTLKDTGRFINWNGTDHAW